MAHYVLIEQTWASSKFNCPVCGANVCTDEKATDKPCPHVLFSWIDQVGEFYNLAPSLKEAVEHEDFFHPSDDEFLDQCLETAVLFAL